MNKPIRIKIFSSFCDSHNCKNVYERLCETHLIPTYGKDKEIYITTDDDYTHVIILNTAMPVLKNIPKENVIGLAFEPPAFLNLTKEFVYYSIKYIGRYYIGTKGDLPHPFYEHYSYMWHTTPLYSLPDKKRFMSIMVSQKIDAPGHKYRHTLVQRILSSGLPIDIYGRGSSFYKKKDPIETMSFSKVMTTDKQMNQDPRIKGEFQEIEPYLDYCFHICIENFKTNHYFSEKITNPLLCGTIPVYWGANKIEEYFPDNVICLSGNLEEDFELLCNIYKDPVKYRKEISVEKIKEKLNLVKKIEELFPFIEIKNK
jgi:hypothetical protein